MACRSRIEHHEGAPRFRDNMRESMEHGDFLGAWRSKILKQQRPALLVKVTAAACQYFRDIPLRLDPGVDPVDRQARHRAINDESDVSCRIGRAEVDGMHAVHLSTTDPAAHVAFVVNGAMPGLTVDRIDPRVETERYVAKIMASRGRDLDEQGRALLLEDLASPCTEEVAVFHAFSHVVAEARSAFVVLDTAPTGHTLLLLDATGAYHRQMTSQFEPSGVGRIVTPLMRLQDPTHTRVILVTLPETTPVSEAACVSAWNKDPAFG